MATRYFRRVIRITGQDSPNVRLAEAEIASGLPPSHRELVEGVLSYAEYCKRRRLWDKQRQTVGLDARFYDGPELLLYPWEWLERAAVLARQRTSIGKTCWLGIDTAEGGDSSCWSIVDHYGLVKLLSMKTPDTSVVTSQTLGLMREYNIAPERVMFDRGGGGKEHADRLRSQRFPVRTIAFGEAVQPDLKRRRVTPLEERREEKEDRYVYKNRRAEMYHILHLLMDPLNGSGFAIPSEREDVAYATLRRQMAPIPKLYDSEGRLYLLPKHKRNPDSDEKTLDDLCGGSPDELDSLVIACYCRQHKSTVATAGIV